jgi:hypothetical protein
MDKVQKRSINECYTPSSEPYRVYKCLTVDTKNSEMCEIEFFLKLEKYYKEMGYEYWPNIF